MRTGSGGLGIIERGAIAARDGRIAWVGTHSDLPSVPSSTVIDCEGRWMTPGLIDCHTHLVHAGDRTEEFDARRSGISYQQIAARGGGILSTVRATRAASTVDLETASRRRLECLAASGVTTVEIKSGYGLDLATERKQLVVATQLAVLCNVHVVRSFLGAHVVPPEYSGRAEQYVEFLCTRVLPVLVADGLVDCVDAYLEPLAFSQEHVRKLFTTARAHGLSVRLHADQLSDGNGAGLAAEYQALSADHLEFSSSAGVEALARSGTVATLLPGAYYFLREQRQPPIDLLRRCGVPMAVATDCNPGTSPMSSLLAAMNLAATLFGLTVEECWLGTTRHAAQALGLSASRGALEVGKRCDLAIWDVDRLAVPVQTLGFQPLHMRVKEGVACH